MFGSRGNPQAKNLFAVIGYLQKKAGLHLRVAAGGLAESVPRRSIWAWRIALRFCPNASRSFDVSGPFYLLQL